jgi:hypothetical protein
VVVVVGSGGGGWRFAATCWRVADELDEDRESPARAVGTREVVPARVVNSSTAGGWVGRGCHRHSHAQGCGSHCRVHQQSSGCASDNTCAIKEIEDL